MRSLGYLRRLKSWTWTCVAAVAVLATGCGGDGPELAGVRGTVRLNNEPVKFAQVTFIPVGPGRSASGLANEDGEYELQYTPSASGALLGPVTVEISTKTVDTPETIPAKYNTKTELRRDVQSGSNVFDFDLQSK